MCQFPGLGTNWVVTWGCGVETDDVSSVPSDYDVDPARSQSWDRSWLVPSSDSDYTGARRLTAEALAPILDVGCGSGSLAAELPPRAGWIGLDFSPTQLAQVQARPVVRADARRLPFRSGSVGAVVCHWMLYHFDDPTEVIAEARRVLRPGGLFLASTSARDNDPELALHGYPPTTFDAEEASTIVASVFGEGAIEVEAWDGPFLVLPDRHAVTRYARHHSLPAGVADSVTVPLTVTKRGCFIWARR